MQSKTGNGVKNVCSINIVRLTFDFLKHFKNTTIKHQINLLSFCTMYVISYIVMHTKQ